MGLAHRELLRRRGATFSSNAGGVAARLWCVFLILGGGATVQWAVAGDSGSEMGGGARSLAEWDKSGPVAEG